MNISVIIPTCNRKSRLLKLLDNLNHSIYPLYEVIVIDSGEENLSAADYLVFNELSIQYLASEKSVCIQRNIGINQAKADWIFLCDDDIEVPADYLASLVNHIQAHSEAGAVSGLVLQKDAGKWEAKYPVKSAKALVWKYIFQLSFWGEIECQLNSLTNRIKEDYDKKGNHISKSGWPVITQFSGDYFVTPVYGLGASLVKREWLINSMYDEVLDRHGIGDNYGVAVGFPSAIHVCNHAFVYHHQAPENRISKASQYYRRILALDYFRKTKNQLAMVTKRHFVWSLLGNLLSFTVAGNFLMLKATLKALGIIVFNNNPYYLGAKAGKKVVIVNTWN